jgi:hypothetical protein
MLVNPCPILGAPFHLPHGGGGGGGGGGSSSSSGGGGGGSSSSSSVPRRRCVPPPQNPEPLSAYIKNYLRDHHHSAACDAPRAFLLNYYKGAWLEQRCVPPPNIDSFASFPDPDSDSWHAAEEGNNAAIHLIGYGLRHRAMWNGNLDTIPEKLLYLPINANGTLPSFAALANFIDRQLRNLIGPAVAFWGHKLDFVDKRASFAFLNERAVASLCALATMGVFAYVAEAKDLESSGRAGVAGTSVSYGRPCDTTNGGVLAIISRYGGRAMSEVIFPGKPVASTTVRQTARSEAAEASGAEGGGLLTEGLPGLRARKPAAPLAPISRASHINPHTCTVGELYRNLVTAFTNSGFAVYLHGQLCEIYDDMNDSCGGEWTWAPRGAPRGDASRGKKRHMEAAAPAPTAARAAVGTGAPTAAPVSAVEEFITVSFYRARRLGSALRAKRRS